jgi:hypothetical protein
MILASVRVVRWGVLAAVVIAVIVGGIRYFDRAPTAELPADTGAAPPPTSSAAPAVITESTDPFERPQLSPIPPVPPPSVEWLRAAANPTLVSVTPEGGRTAEKSITMTGGDVTLTTPDRVRMTLIVEPGALDNATDLTLTLVEVADLPFDGPAVAVQIGPDSLFLKKAARLRIEPRTPAERPDTIGFTVRGRELNLFPAYPSADGSPRPRPATELRVTSPGIFGIAPASPAAIVKAGSQVPTDYLARLEHRVALALFPRDVVPRSAWNLLPVVHAQELSPTAWLQQLLTDIGDLYTSEILPRFKSLPKDDCLSPAIWDAIRRYYQWQALNELLLPLQVDPSLTGLPYKAEFDRLVAQRVSMLQRRGFSLEQIKEIDRQLEAYRKTIEEIGQHMRTLMAEALKTHFASAYRCCMTMRPLAYHLDTMRETAKHADVNGMGPVDESAVAKIMECACRVRSASKGAPEGFVGSITQTETLKVEERKEPTGGGGRMQRSSSSTKTASYTMTMHIMRPLPDGSMLAEAHATGSLTDVFTSRDDWGTCVYESNTELTLDGNNRDSTPIDIRVLPQQKRYTISYTPLVVEGSGLRRRKYEVSGARCNPFEFKKNRTDVDRVERGIPSSNVPIAGVIEAGSPFLRGSVEAEGQPVLGARPSVRVQWELRRCGG